MINEETSRAVYQGDGQSTEFVIPFTFGANEAGVFGKKYQLAVYKCAAKKEGETLPASILLNEDTDYEVDGSRVRFFSAPKEGQTVTVLRDVPLTQQVSYSEQRAIPVEGTGQALDKLTQIAQQHAELLARTLRVDPADTETPVRAEDYLNAIVSTAHDAKESITQAKDEAVAAGEEAVEAAKNAADQAQEAAGQVQGAVSELTGYVLAAESAKTAAQAAAQNASEAAGAAQGAAEEAAQEALAQSKAYTDVKTGEVRGLVNALQLVKFVPALPETGESKYLYAVPQDEKTLDGENIVLLFVWDDTDGWATVGVQTTAVDLSEYAKQADLTAEASARKEADQALDTAVSAKYGPDNLTAGAGVEIKEYTVPTLIDAHTLAVFKFEDTAVPAENSVAEGAVFANRGGSADEATAAYGAKFGAGAFRCAGSNVSGWLRNSDSIPNADYTVDFWVKWGNSGRAGVCTGVNSDAPTGRGVIFYKNKLALPQAAGTGYINEDSVFDTAYDGAVWHHVAYEQKGHAYRVYIDGVQVAQGEYTSFGSQSELYIWGWGGVLIDEVRVSDIARYDGDFTPNTQPYAYAEHKQYEITAKASGAGLPLLSVHWSDHLLNRMDMLRADTFSWQDGTVYTAAYNELLTEYNNAAGADETDGSISFKRTPKGYKICAADQHDNVADLYNTTGVAWYYILDVPNQRFKLPRTKFGFTGLRTGAGNYVAPGLPNITGDFNAGGVWTRYASGAFKVPTAEVGGDGPSGNGSLQTRYTFDASRSSSVYGSSQTVQPPATEMYLYFFIGNFTQSAVEQTAGLNAEAINELSGAKLDKSAIVRFETPYQQMAVNQAYTFDLTNSGLLNIPQEKWRVKFMLKMTTAIGSLAVGDVVEVVAAGGWLSNYGASGLIFAKSGNNAKVVTSTHDVILWYPSSSSGAGFSNTQIKLCIEAVNA